MRDARSSGSGSDRNQEKIPNAIRSLVAAGGAYFLKSVAFFLRIRNTFVRVFSSMVGRAFSFYTAIVGVFTRIRDRIRSILRGIVDIAFRLLGKLPDILLPESLIRLKHSGFVADRTIEKTTLRSERVSASMPAAVEVNRRSEDIGQLRSEIAGLARKQPEADKKDINIKLQVDGQTLAEATHKAGQESAGRAFSKVPAL